MFKISEHISYVEGVYSKLADQLNIKNIPNATQLLNMIAVANEVFEPMRRHFNVPIYISSFFRCKELNLALGGSSTSDHMRGKAIDVDAKYYGRINNKHIFNYIRNNLKFDQLIAEVVNEDENKDIGWVHFSWRSKVSNRNQILLSERIGNNKVFYKYDSQKGLNLKLYRNNE